MASFVLRIYEESGSYRRLKGMYVTQDTYLADSEAAGDESLTANQGAVDMAYTTYPSDGYGLQAIKWLESEPTELSRKKAAANTLHQYLKEVTEGIHAVRHAEAPG